MDVQAKGSGGNREPRGSATFRHEVTDALVEAVLEELADKGFRGMSMDGVARRAGVGKSAIYRRWSSKEEMTLDVIQNLAVGDGSLEDTGALATDITAMLNDVLAWLGAPRISRIYPDLLAESQRNPAFFEAMTTHLGNPRRAKAQLVLDRASARGELSSSFDNDLALDLLAAPIFWRLIALGRPVTQSYVDRVSGALLTLIAKT